MAASTKNYSSKKFFLRDIAYLLTCMCKVFIAIMFVTVKKKKSETTLSAHYQECCSINYGVICLLCSTKQLLKNESYIIHVLTEHEGWGWRGAMNHIAKQYMSDFMWIKRVCAPTYLYQAFLKDRKKH